MASRRPLMPALCALRQAARHSCHHQQPATAAAAAKATAAAGPRTFSSIAAQPSTQRKHRTVGVVAPPLPAGAPASRWRRYYSQERQQPPPGNKIWSFEDVQKLTQEAKPNVVIVGMRHTPPLPILPLHACMCSCVHMRVHTHTTHAYMMGTNR